MTTYKLKYNLYKKDNKLTTKKVSQEFLVAYHGTHFVFDSYNRKLIRLLSCSSEKEIVIELEYEDFAKWFEKV